MTALAILIGVALIAAGILPDRPIVLLWAPGLALVLVASERHREQRAARAARRRARKRKGYLR